MRPSLCPDKTGEVNSELQTRVFNWQASFFHVKIVPAPQHDVESKHKCLCVVSEILFLEPLHPDTDVARKRGLAHRAVPKIGVTELAVFSTPQATSVVPPTR